MIEKCDEDFKVETANKVFTEEIHSPELFF
jgi:hypothetical protein